MDKRRQVTTPRQLDLSLTIAKEIEVDGVGMGVLSDGTPYLTARGLARMCGIDHVLILRITAGWSLSEPRPREEKIKATLHQQGHNYSTPYIPIPVGGVVHHAFPDPVCMAVLEYYAFEAGQACNKQALANYRRLARKSFRDFIYTQVGYNPADSTPLNWQPFLDRVSLSFNRVPAGYFSIFKEIADLTELLIRSGAQIGSAFIPDLSVGQHWSKYWQSRDLEKILGTRLQYLHDYPSYFPQAAANPQHPFCYPDAALPEFRRWMWADYLPKHFPSYLATKVKSGGLPVAHSERALKAIAQQVAGRQLPH